MKKTQEQLKAEFKNELEKTSSWRESPKMIDYELKQAAYLVELHDWGFMVIDKPRIETRFCFWYSDSRADNSDFDRAQGAADYARTHEDYFIEQNLEGINRTIENLKNALESENLRGEHCENFYILEHAYCGDLPECRLRSWESLDKYEVEQEKARLLRTWNSIEEMTREDIENRLEGLEIVKANFIKRLNTYLKRYGLEKLNVWTYWRDY